MVLSRRRESGCSNQKNGKKKIYYKCERWWVWTTERYLVKMVEKDWKFQNSLFSVAKLSLLKEAKNGNKINGGMGEKGRGKNWVHFCCESFSSGTLLKRNFFLRGKEYHVFLCETKRIFFTNVENLLYSALDYLLICNEYHYRYLLPYHWALRSVLTERKRWYFMGLKVGVTGSVTHFYGYLYLQSNKISLGKEKWTEKSIIYTGVNVNKGKNILNGRKNMLTSDEGESNRWIKILGCHCPTFGHHGARSVLFSK